MYLDNNNGLMSEKNKIKTNCFSLVFLFFFFLGKFVIENEKLSTYNIQIANERVYIGSYGGVRK